MPQNFDPSNLLVTPDEVFPPGFFEAAGRGVGAGVEVVKGSAGESLAALGRATAIGPLEQVGRDIASKAARAQAKYTVPTQRVEDIEGISDFAGYAGYTIGQQLPILATLAATRGAGGVAAVRLGAPKAAGQIAGLITGDLPLQFAEVKQDLREAGVSEAESDVAALGAAIPRTALDIAPVELLFRRFGVRPGVGLTKRVAGSAGVIGAAEALTEVSQEAIGAVTRSIYDPEFDVTGEEAQSRYLNAAVAAFIAGGAFGGVGGIPAVAEPEAAPAPELPEVVPAPITGVREQLGFEGFEEAGIEPPILTDIVSPQAELFGEPLPEIDPRQRELDFEAISPELDLEVEPQLDLFAQEGFRAQPPSAQPLAVVEPAVVRPEVAEIRKTSEPLGSSADAKTGRRILVEGDPQERVFEIDPELRPADGTVVLKEVGTDNRLRVPAQQVSLLHQESTVQDLDERADILEQSLQVTQLEQLPITQADVEAAKVSASAAGAEQNTLTALDGLVGSTVADITAIKTANLPKVHRDALNNLRASASSRQFGAHQRTSTQISRLRARAQELEADQFTLEPPSTVTASVVIPGTDRTIDVVEGGPRRQFDLGEDIAGVEQGLELEHNPAQLVLELEAPAPRDILTLPKTKIQDSETVQIRKLMDKFDRIISSPTSYTVIDGRQYFTPQAAVSLRKLHASVTNRVEKLNTKLVGKGKPRVGFGTKVIGKLSQALGISQTSSFEHTLWRNAFNRQFEQDNKTLEERIFDGVGTDLEAEFLRLVRSRDSFFQDQNKGVLKETAARRIARVLSNHPRYTSLIAKGEKRLSKETQGLVERLSLALEDDAEMRAEFFEQVQAQVEQDLQFVLNTPVYHTEDTGVAAWLQDFTDAQYADPANYDVRLEAPATSTDAETIRQLLRRADIIKQNDANYVEFRAAAIDGRIEDKLNISSYVGRNVLNEQARTSLFRLVRDIEQFDGVALTIKPVVAARIAELEKIPAAQVQATGLNTDALKSVRAIMDRSPRFSAIRDAKERTKMAAALIAYRTELAGTDPADASTRVEYGDTARTQGDISEKIYFNPLDAQFKKIQAKFYDFTNVRYQAYTESDALGEYYDERQSKVNNPETIEYRYVISQPNEVLNSFVETAQLPDAVNEDTIRAALATKELMLRKLVTNLEIPPAFPIEFVEYVDDRAQALRNQTGELFQEIISRTSNQLESLILSAEAVREDIVAGRNIELIERSNRLAALAQRELDLRKILPQIETEALRKYSEAYIKLENRLFRNIKELRKRGAFRVPTSVTSEYAAAQGAEHAATQRYEAARTQLSQARTQIQDLDALITADVEEASVNFYADPERSKLAKQVVRATTALNKATAERDRLQVVYREQEQVFDARKANVDRLKSLGVSPAGTRMKTAMAAYSNAIRDADTTEKAIEAQIEAASKAVNQRNTAQAKLAEVQDSVTQALSSVQTRSDMQAQLQTAQTEFDTAKQGYEIAVDNARALQESFTQETRTDSLEAAKEALRLAEKDLADLIANPGPFKAKRTRAFNAAKQLVAGLNARRPQIAAEQRGVNKQIRRVNSLIEGKSTLTPDSALQAEINEHRLTLESLDSQRVQLLQSVDALQEESVVARNNLKALSKDRGKEYSQAITAAKSNVTRAIANVNAARKQLSNSLTDEEKNTSFDDLKDALEAAEAELIPEIEATALDEFEQEITDNTHDEYNSLTATSEELGISTTTLQEDIAKVDEIVAFIEKQLGVARVTIQVPFADKTAGSYDPTNSIIGVSLNAVDALSVAAHEAYHAAYFKILTKREQSIVRNALKQGSALRKRLEQIIRETQSLEDAESVIDSMGDVASEAEAYAYQFWISGQLQTTGVLGNVFARLRQFFESIRNKIRGVGFKTDADAAVEIFQALAAGKLANRTTVDSMDAHNVSLHETAASVQGNLPITKLYSRTGTVNGTNPDLQDEAQAVADNLPDSQLEKIFSGFPETLKPKNMRESAQRIWSNTFASMQHIARYSPAARAVFDVVREMTARRDTIISDESTVLFNFAGSSGFRFLKRRGEVSENTQKKVSEAVFAGTTEKTVYSPEILRTRFNLTPEQINWYVKVRASVDSLLTQNYEAQARKAEQRGDNDSAAKLRAHLTELLDTGYFPKRRYGQFRVKVTANIDGDSVPLAMHLAETESERESIANHYDTAFKGNADVKVSRDYQNQEVLVEHSIEFNSFLDRLSLYEERGLKIPEGIKKQMYSDMTDSINALSKRHRFDITGESRDVARVLADFVGSQASAVASYELSSKLDAAIKDGRWNDEGANGNFHKEKTIQMVNFIRSNNISEDETGEVLGKLRAGAALAYLGGNISHGVIQLSQLAMATAPLLVNVASVTDTYSSILKGMKDTAAFKFRDIALMKEAVKRKRGIDNLSANEVEALLKASEDGTVQAQQIFAVSGIARGKLLARSSTARRAADLWMSPFVLSEELNRRTTLIAAYRIGKGLQEQGKALTSPTTEGLTFDNLYDFARHAVDESQFIYTRANRPKFARSGVGAVLFTFKSYPVFMIELFRALPPKGKRTMLATLWLASGTSGLFFSDDLFDLIDTLTQLTGIGPADTKREARLMLNNMGDSIGVDDFSDLIMHGVLNPVLAEIPGTGAGFDIGGRLGLGNIIPGTDILQRSGDLGESLAEIGGPVGSLLKGAYKSAAALTQGDIEGAVSQLPLSGISNLAKAGTWVHDDYTARNVRGSKIADVDGWQVLAKSIGFSPLQVSRMYEIDKSINKAQSYIGQITADYKRELVQAVNRKDRRKERELFESIADWNRAHPEPQYKLDISRSSIRRAVKRAGLTPVERRLEGLRKGQRVGFRNEVEDLLSDL